MVPIKMSNLFNRMNAAVSSTGASYTDTLAGDAFKSILDFGLDRWESYLFLPAIKIGSVVGNEGFVPQMNSRLQFETIQGMHAPKGLSIIRKLQLYCILLWKHYVVRRYSGTEFVYNRMSFNRTTGF
jgi:hypothetical protein